MPPKTKPAQGSKKADTKKKEKIIEDKTFGLKNKKGSKQQKFIQQVQNQVKFGGTSSSRKLDELKKNESSKKDDKKKEQEELNKLFKPVTVQKVEKGADPKSVLCAFFKQGQCGKKDKCKFSHDLTLERKAEKRSAYCDIRDEDNMENWDEQKLKEVVEKKHAEADSKKPKTEIICKFFLDALEKNKYGWFWECPNGERCIYRHALPPGFMLNKDKKREDKKDEISIEDLVERERANLGSSLTKVTLESFLKWKKRKLAEKEELTKKDDARKKAEFKAGRSVGLSGREMFTFKPEMAADDITEEGEATFDTQNMEKDEEGEEYVEVYEITLEGLVSAARESDGTGTIGQPKAQNGIDEAQNSLDEGAVGGQIDEEDNSENEDEVPIDENLFVDDDDLEELENELDNVELNGLRNE
ncbi:hypothetical protein CHUAL_000330 [Chamberlinius hualienensis]